MENIGILVDTTCDLDLVLQDTRNIKFVPLQIIFNDMRTFRDKVEIDYEETMNGIINYEAKTSLPIGEDIINAFDDFVSEGYTHVIALMLSDGLSGTFNLVNNIAQNYKNKLEFENIPTKSTTWAIGHYVLKALDMIEKGKTYLEISDYLNNNILRNRIFFGVETLKYLVRGGRLNKISGTIGEALDIKPILTLTEEGKIETVEKVRGRKKSLSRIVELGKKIDDEIEKMYIAHLDREEEALGLKSKLEEEFNLPVDIKPLGTLVSVHVGPGLMGVIFIKK